MNNNTKKIKQKFEKKESSKIGIELDINSSFPNSLKNNNKNGKEDKKNISEDDSFLSTDKSFGDNLSNSSSSILLEKKKCNNLNENKEYNINYKLFESKNYHKNFPQKDMDSNLEIKGLDNQDKKDYLFDMFENLINEEIKNKSKLNPNYFDFQHYINYKMRAILIDWLVEIHYKLELKEETFYTAIYIMDAYLSKKIIKKNKFQLLGITSLLIASKLNEMFVGRIKNYSIFTDNAFSTEEIINMESDISKTLEFDFLFPTPIIFYEIIAINTGLKNDLYKYKFGEFLIQNFLIDSKSFKYKYSIISFSSFYLLMKLFKLDIRNYCNNTLLFLMVKISDSNSDIINECSESICRTISEMKYLNINSTIKKYSCKHFKEDINKLISFHRCENI